ncbi:MAG: helix-turn-helix transcriptional regulator [Bacteroidales bacterium]
MADNRIADNLKPYLAIARMIGHSFGRNCEVVLHDLSIPQKSVIYVVNGHVTGRIIGQPFDHLLSIVLSSKDFKDDYLANYQTRAKDGRLIKSSTALIRDSRNYLIGALCINYDISMAQPFQEFINDFIATNAQIKPTAEFSESISESVESVPESHDSITETTTDLIRRIIGNAEVKSMKRSVRISLIRFMEEKGVFMIKGSIDTVAELMGISKVTVYSYLDVVRKGNVIEKQIQ